MGKSTCFPNMRILKNSLFVPYLAYEIVGSLAVVLLCVCAFSIRHFASIKEGGIKRHIHIAKGFRRAGSTPETACQHYIDRVFLMQKMKKCFSHSIEYILIRLIKYGSAAFRNLAFCLLFTRHYYNDLGFQTRLLQNLNQNDFKEACWRK